MRRPDDPCRPTTRSRCPTPTTGSVSTARPRSCSTSAPRPTTWCSTAGSWARAACGSTDPRSSGGSSSCLGISDEEAQAEVRVPARRVPLRRPAARRVRVRHRPAGGPPGGRGEHPGGHRLPQDAVRRRPPHRRRRAIDAAQLDELGLRLLPPPHLSSGSPPCAGPRTAAGVGVPVCGSRRLSHPVLRWGKPVGVRRCPATVGDDRLDGSSRVGIPAPGLAPVHRRGMRWGAGSRVSTRWDPLRLTLTPVRSRSRIRERAVQRHQESPPQDRSTIVTGSRCGAIGFVVGALSLIGAVVVLTTFAGPVSGPRRPPPTVRTAAGYGAAWLADRSSTSRSRWTNFGCPDWGVTLDAGALDRCTGVGRGADRGGLGGVRGGSRRRGRSDRDSPVWPVGQRRTLARAILFGEAHRRPTRVRSARTPGADLVAPAGSRSASTDGPDTGLFGDQDPTYDGAFRQGYALAALVARRGDAGPQLDRVAARPAVRPRG